MEPDCCAVKVAEPLSRVHQQEQSMVGVGGVSPDDVSPGQPVFFFLCLGWEQETS